MEAPMSKKILKLIFDEKNGRKLVEQLRKNIGIISIGEKLYKVKKLGR